MLQSRKVQNSEFLPKISIIFSNSFFAEKNINLICMLNCYFTTTQELLGTTDFLLSDDSVVFRTCPREKNQLIFQMVIFLYFPLLISTLHNSTME